MKKYVLLFILILQITVVFGQKEGEGATVWTSWGPASPCFPNLYISYKSLGWAKSVSKYQYNFRLKNTSNKHLHFNLDIRFVSGEDYTADGRFDLQPNSERTHVSMYYNTKPIPNKTDFFSSMVTKYIENDGGDDWTVLSYSCDGSRKVCDANCENSNGTKAAKNLGVNANNVKNSSNQTISPTDYDAQINALLDEKDNLCGQFAQYNNATGTSLCGKKREEYLTRLVGTENQVNNRKKEIINELKRDIQEIKGVLSGAESGFNKQKIAQQELEKRRSAEKTAFNSNMEKGDAAMGTKDYAQAMNYYEIAKTSTTDAADQAQAQSKYKQALEAKKAAEREVRVAQARDRDKAEDAAYTSAAAGTAGLMAMITDGYSSKGFAGKFLLGLGYESSPILSNNSSNYSVNKSYIETRSLLTIHTGFTFGILNNKAISIYLKPQANMGISAYVPGVSGGFVSYGGTGVLQLATKKHSKFNVFAEGGWFGYNGTFKYDADAVNNTATDDVREGKIKYNTIRYGGGFMLRWIDDGNETYLRPAVFYDKPSFFTSAVKPVLSMNLQINIYSAIILDFTYTPKTYIPGELLYPATLERKNVNYFGIKIIRQGRLN